MRLRTTVALLLLLLLVHGGLNKKPPDWRLGADAMVYTNGANEIEAYKRVEQQCVHLNYQSLAGLPVEKMATQVSCAVIVVSSEADTDWARLMIDRGNALVVRLYNRVSAETMNDLANEPYPATRPDAYRIPEWQVELGEYAMARQIPVQIYNEPDLDIEVENADWVGFAPFSRLYGLGRVVCGVAGVFNVDYGRLFFAIPGLSNATKERTSEYLRGCVAGLLTPRGIVNGGGTFVFAVHAYAPTCSPSEAAQLVVDNVQKQVEAANAVVSSYPAFAVQYLVSEAGMGYGFGCTRAEQASMFALLPKSPPYAWWVYIGEKCYPSDTPTWSNTPDEWAKMAWYGVNGEKCKR